MNTRTLLDVLLAAAVVAVAQLQAQTDPRHVTCAPLREVQIPTAERFELENGLVVLALEDHELPLIEMFGIMGVGGVNDPADKAGLAAICATVMRTGGSTSTPGDRMDDILEALAASVEISAGTTVSSARVSALKENFGQALALFAEVLKGPAFPEEKLQLAKVEHNGMISRRNDEPFGIAGREFSRLIYGASSPYARQEEYATVGSISRDDLVAFHRQWFQPNNVVLAVSGDFDPAQLREQIRRTLGDWRKTDFKRQAVPEAPYDFTASVNLVKKTDISQAHVWLGHLAGTMKDPDYPALVVMQEIFGSGFTSRLFTNVRSRLGLSYNVYGAYGCNYDYPGTFMATCQTKAESMSVALDAMNKEIAGMTSGLVTEEELATAKDRYLNAFVFNLDSRAKIVQRLMEYEFYGYPADFLQKTRANLEKVSREDVLRVAQKHLKPDCLRILVVGNPEKFDQQLSRYGTVQEIDITIPGQPAEATVAP